MLPLEIASELDRLIGCQEIKRNAKLKMDSFDPDCHFIADIGQMQIKQIDEKPFSDRMFASEGGYESDDEREEGDVIVGGFVDDSDVESDTESDLEIEKSNSE